MLVELTIDNDSNLHISIPGVQLRQDRPDQLILHQLTRRDVTRPSPAAVQPDPISGGQSIVKQIRN